MSDRRYEILDAQYAKEQAELTAEISALEKAVKGYEKHEKDADRFIALIDKYEMPVNRPGIGNVALRRNHIAGPVL